MGPFPTANPSARIWEGWWTGEGGGHLLPLNNVKMITKSQSVVPSAAIQNLGCLIHACTGFLIWSGHAPFHE